MLENNQFEQTSENSTQTKGPKSKKTGCLGFAIDTIETILLALVLFLAINALSARVRVENVSMQPTLKPGEFLLINRVAYRFGNPSIGDIIVFHAPGQDNTDYIKRVIGLPGDQITISDGIVYVNNQPLYEPYIAESPRYTGSWDIPAEHYFVLGDNRNNSSDSHMWGFIPREDIVGRALLIYWPISEMTLLRTSTIVQAVQ